MERLKQELNLRVLDETENRDRSIFQGSEYMSDIEKGFKTKRDCIAKSE